MRIYCLCVFFIFQKLLGMCTYENTYLNKIDTRKQNVTNKDSKKNGTSECSKKKIKVDDFESIVQFLEQVACSLALLSLENPQNYISDQNELLSLLDFFQMVSNAEYNERNKLLSVDDNEDKLVLSYAKEYECDWNFIMQYISYLKKIDDIIKLHGNQLAKFLSHCSSYSYYCCECLEGWKEQSEILLHIAADNSYMFEAIRECINEALRTIDTNDVPCKIDTNSATVRIKQYRVYVNDYDINLFEYLLKNTRKEQKYNDSK